MPWFFKKIGCLWLVLSFVFAAPAIAQSPPVESRWDKPKNDNPTLRTLGYSSSTVLLGKNISFAVDFFCDPNTGKNSAGALGFGITVPTAPLKAFNFEAFEGPDAVASSKKLLQVLVLRQDKPVLTLNSELSGSTPDAGKFSFGVSDLSRAANSPSKSVLRKLAEDVDTLQLTITDFKNPKLKLEFSVPVAGKQTEFKALLAGVK